MNLTDIRETYKSHELRVHGSKGDWAMTIDGKEMGNVKAQNTALRLCRETIDALVKDEPEMVSVPRKDVEAIALALRFLVDFAEETSSNYFISGTIDYEQMRHTRQHLSIVETALKDGKRG